MTWVWGLIVVVRLIAVVLIVWGLSRTIRRWDLEDEEAEEERLLWLEWQYTTSDEEM